MKAAPIAHIRRYREILVILARHGVGFLAGGAVTGRLPRAVRGWRRSARGASSPEHLTSALEELGTTFIKVGQILSTRADLLPPAYARALERLQDHVPPVPTAEIRAVIEEDLGRTVDSVFAHFADTPLASASIGQVHRAEMLDGRHVVVKVQKPGVAQRVDVDLAILRHLARVAASRGLLARFLDPVALVEEFAWTLEGECDYQREARNAAALARNFAGDANLRVPCVLGAFTTRRVLVMEELQGIRIDDAEGLRAAGIDTHALAKRSARILLRSIFDHGLYHADPHPGNFLVSRDGGLAALDFGMVGRLDAGARDALLRVALAVVQREPPAVVAALEALGVRPSGGDRRPLVREVAHLLDAFADRPLGEIALAPLIGEIFGLMRRFELHLPADLALLLKTLAMNEGVGRQLDPGFVATQQAAEYLRDLAIRRVTSPRWVLASLRAAGEGLAATARLPQRLDLALSSLEAGEIRLNATEEYWRRTHREVSLAANRIALAILAAGLAISAALAAASGGPSVARAWMAGWPLAAGGGAVVFGLAVLVSMARHRR